MRKDELVSLIRSTEGYTNPKVQLEQYCIDAASAVNIVFFAGIEHDDIKSKVVLDLGTGTGRLSITSAFLRAQTIISVDIDPQAIKILRENMNNLNLSHIINPIITDIGCLEFSRNFIEDYEITTIMNPPFGVQTRQADRIFLQKAFTFSDVIYSIHMAGKQVQRFLKEFSRNFGWIIDYTYPFLMTLEKSYLFHTKKTKKIQTQVYRFIQKDSKKRK
ncbi:MAG: METTL5 family protein [Promethearchaeia archaeon]